jgi:hypothetical protein
VIAHLSIVEGRSVQDLEYSMLMEELARHSQILENNN